MCLILLPQLALADDKPKPKTPFPKAKVHGDKCTFHFPIENTKRVWDWGVSPANRCEYSWMVTVKRGETSYQLGFSHFNPVPDPQSGSLARLLETGQSDVWKLDADGTGASNVDGKSVTCRAARDHLEIVLDSEAWTKKLFADRPKTVQFETSGTQLKRTKTTVKVDYKMTD